MSYSKAETDLAIASALTSYRPATIEDILLATKANVADVYTRPQIDSSLSQLSSNASQATAIVQAELSALQGSVAGIQMGLGSVNNSQSLACNKDYADTQLATKASAVDVSTLQQTVQAQQVALGAAASQVSLTQTSQALSTQITSAVTAAQATLEAEIQTLSSFAHDQVAALATAVSTKADSAHTFTQSQTHDFVASALQPYALSADLQSALSPLATKDALAQLKVETSAALVEKASETELGNAVKMLQAQIAQVPVNIGSVTAQTVDDKIGAALVPLATKADLASAVLPLQTAPQVTAAIQTALAATSGAFPFTALQLGRSLGYDNMNYQWSKLFASDAAATMFDSSKPTLVTIPADGVYRFSGWAGTDWWKSSVHTDYMVSLQTDDDSVQKWGADAARWIGPNAVSFNYFNKVKAGSQWWLHASNGGQGVDDWSWFQVERLA